MQYFLLVLHWLISKNLILHEKEQWSKIVGKHIIWHTKLDFHDSTGAMVANWWVVRYRKPSCGGMKSRRSATRNVCCSSTHNKTSPTWPHKDRSRSREEPSKWLPRQPNQDKCRLGNVSIALSYGVCSSRNKVPFCLEDWLNLKIFTFYVWHVWEIWTIFKLPFAVYLLILGRGRLLKNSIANIVKGDFKNKFLNFF